MSEILSPPFSGDYSFNVFAERKRYAGVLQQQGKQIVDVDLNDGAQLTFAKFTRMVQSAFPSQFVGEAFKIIQTPTAADGSFFILARRAAGNPASAVDPESFARGYIRGLPVQITDSDGNEGRPFALALESVIPGGQEVFDLAEIHHRSTNIVSNTVYDDNARYVPGELAGRTLQILDPEAAAPDNVQSFAITGNTANTISLSTTPPASLIGKFYRVDPTSVGVSARVDLVWLDVFIGEYGAAEDANLLHPIGAGLETSRRLTLVQQVRYSQGVTLDFATPNNMLPFGAVYQQTVGATGLIHYATPLAVIQRPANTDDITDVLITDLRDPHFGSSDEVVAARDGYDSLLDKLNAIDPEITTRYSAQPTDLLFTNTAFQAIYQAVGYTGYVGLTPVENVADIARLYAPDGLTPSLTRVPNIVSDHIQGGSPDYQTPGSSLNWSVRLPGGAIVSGTVTVPAISDPAALTQAVNALNGDSGFAVHLNASEASGRALIIRGKNTLEGKDAYIEFLDSGGLLSDWFTAMRVRYPNPSNDGLRVDCSRTPKLIGVSSNVFNDVRGAGDGPTTSFESAPYYVFDGQIDGQKHLRFGAATFFKDELEKAPIVRSIFEADVPIDRRLEVEHYADGQHKNDFLQSQMVDWGTGTGQINASDVPASTPAQPDLTAVTVQGLINEIANHYVNRAGLAAFAMQGNLSLGGNKAIGAADPTVATDLATKGYVDAVAVGLIILQSVAAATRASGVDNPSAYSTTNDGEFTTVPANVDSVPLLANDRVLVKNQANQVENGVYFVVTPSVLWRRVSDFNSDEALTSGTAVFVDLWSGGSNVNEGATWVMTTAGNPQIGGVSGAANVWSQFTATGDIEAGDGLTKTGSTLDVNPDTTLGTTVINGANEVAVDLDSIFEPSTTTGLTRSAGKVYIAVAAGGQGLQGAGVANNGVLQIKPGDFMDAAFFASVDTLGAANVTIAAGAITPTELSPTVDAGAIPFIPVGTIAATDVQAAIAEVADEAVQISGDTMTGTLRVPIGGIRVGLAGAEQLRPNGFDLELFRHDQITRGDSLASRALVKVVHPTNALKSVLNLNHGGDFSGGVQIPIPAVPGDLVNGAVLNAAGSVRLTATGDFILNNGFSLKGHSHAGSGSGGQITSAGIADGAVLTAKIGDDQVTPAKVALGSLLLASIMASSVAISAGTASFDTAAVTGVLPAGRYIVLARVRKASLTGTPLTASLTIVGRTDALAVTSYTPAQTLLSNHFNPYIDDTNVEAVFTVSGVIRVIPSLPYVHLVLGIWGTSPDAISYYPAEIALELTALELF